MYIYLIFLEANTIREAQPAKLKVKSFSLHLFQYPLFNKKNLNIKTEL
jgi:hypothetical protein